MPVRRTARRLLLVSLLALLGAVALVVPGAQPLDEVAILPAVVAFGAAIASFVAFLRRPREARKGTPVPQFVLALLSGLMIAGLIADTRWYRRSWATSTRLTQETVAAAIRAWHQEHGTYPAAAANEDGARQLLRALLDSGPSRKRLGELSRDSIADGMIVDAFEEPMRYVWDGDPARPPALLSAGADGAFGTKDDIRTVVPSD